MQRRQFIKQLMLSGAALGGLASGTPFQLTLPKALAAEGKTLVNIFQRGGCDGLNVVVPYGEQRYYDLRPTIAIAPPGGDGTALDLNGFFGLHPAMAELHNLFLQGQLALLPATHYPDASRSHFQSQHYIESAIAEDSDTGWMNRHLSSLNQDGLLRAVSIGNDLVQALRGRASVTTLSRLDNVGFGVNGEEEAALLARLQEIYQHPAQELANHQLVHSAGQQFIADIDTLNAINEMPYSPANGAQYPANGFGNQLMTLARIIKADVGLELANVNIGGWDTHADQGAAVGRQANGLAALSQGINAFYMDMGDRMADICIMVGTEFGRTPDENGSFGTDHGFASTWMLLGGGVIGGIYGDWPTLDESAMERGRYLAMATDYRDIYGDLLTGFLANNDVSAVVPEHNYSPLGLFG
ncbi:DUF1501 domain-containing protein [Pseudomaricurvus alkylphenolicus]|uniref:DUF1501 domain-containing protein n=1 Tax=Pseudomaricurvus alkylphenolicus TaxID=1306991 RepID=UPI0014214244|nr:DUF1501 domain-containing protein [Pseudomaricurvus alkylphenolicus]NIB40167.1 DUF1501 domain-containing protein [Pseudomaricurvus alkylphenolicus]